MTFRARILLVALLAACSAPLGLSGSSGTPPSSATQPPLCRTRGTTAALSADWDPDFRSEGVEAVRRVGGYYRDLRATSFEQHRSIEGPTFRVACGDSLRARLLIGIPTQAGPTYKTIFVAFVDYAQVQIELGGFWSAQHHLELQAGAEHMLTFRTGPLSDGIHRLALIFFDDDQEPTGGFFGWHDVEADVYVGADPQLAQLPPMPELPNRTEPALSPSGSGYGVNVTSRPDILRLPAPVRWEPGAQLYVSFWGSAKEGDSPIALVVLQNYRELRLARVDPFAMALAGRVSILSFAPRAPEKTLESLRAVIFTNPGRELAPNGRYEREHLFAAIASQKAYIVR